MKGFLLVVSTNTQDFTQTQTSRNANLPMLKLAYTPFINAKQNEQSGRTYENRLLVLTQPKNQI